MSESNGYLEADERELFLLDLEAACEFAARVLGNPYFWRWVVFALHGAIQGSMVLALTGSDGLRPLRDKDAAAWLEAYRQRNALPDGKLDAFMMLYSKIKNPALMRSHLNSQAFAPGEAHDRSVEKLNEIRNEFVHFTPKSWLLELAGLPRVCLDATEVVEFLVHRSGAILWHERRDLERVSRAIEMLRDQLRGLMGSKRG